MLGVCTSLQFAMIWRIYSERFIPSLLALRSICFNSLSVNQNLILSVLFSIITILSFRGFRGRGKLPPNKCVCGVCTQTRCLLMQCHLQANRIWCTQIQCLLNRCLAARHFWQNAFCFLIKLQCPQRHYLLSEKIAVLPDGFFYPRPEFHRTVASLCLLSAYIVAKSYLHSAGHSIFKVQWTNPSLNVKN